MRVFVLALGTRGDLEIFAALGCALAARGHAVTLASSGFFEPRVRGLGLAFQPVGRGSQAELVAILRSLADVAGHRERAHAYAARWLRPEVAASRAEIAAGVASADYVVNNLKSVWTRNGRLVPGAHVTYEPPGSLENLAKQLPRRLPHEEALLQVVALPKALVDPAERWGPLYRFAGFFAPPPAAPWQPPKALEAFLAAGPPPAVLSMGSMVMFDAKRLHSAFVAALAACGLRGVVVGGWSDIAGAAALPPFVHALEEAPYAWLLPRAACVVHHGGCGTVAAAVRAGRPSVLVPLISSQEHFAEILLREGLAAAALDPAQVSAEALASALRAAVTEPRHGESALRWSERIRVDRGAEAAADAIEAHARGLVSPPGPRAV
jgi:sterol 3beta-glucosyltransferase